MTELLHTHCPVGTLLSDVAQASKSCMTQTLSLPTDASSKLVALDPIAFFQRV